MATTYVISPELLVVGLVLLVFVVVTIVDMARRPGWQWQQAGSSKGLWLTLLIAGYLVGSLLLEIPLIVVGVLYFAMIRPRLRAVENRGGPGGPGWQQGGSWTPPGGQWPGQSEPPPSGPWPTASYPPPAPPGGTTVAPPPPPPEQTAGPPRYPSAPEAPGAIAPAYPSQPAPAELPPFGWYPDPSGRHEQRYWDGTRWTEHVRDGGQDSTEALPG